MNEPVALSGGPMSGLVEGSDWEPGIERDSTTDIGVYTYRRLTQIETGQDDDDRPDIAVFTRFQKA